MIGAYIVFDVQISIWLGEAARATLLQDLGLTRTRVAHLVQVAVAVVIQHQALQLVRQLARVLVLLVHLSPSVLAVTVLPLKDLEVVLLGDLAVVPPTDLAVRPHADQAAQDQESPGALYHRGLEVQHHVGLAVQHPIGQAVLAVMAPADLEALLEVVQEVLLPVGLEHPRPKGLEAMFLAGLGVVQGIPAALLVALLAVALAALQHKR